MSGTASREVDLFLEKRRLACGNGACPRGTFTEWAPQVPPRCRITRRLLEHCGDEVAERGITPAEVGPAQRRLVAVRARGVRGEGGRSSSRDDPAPVAHLGIDEHRRGRARWRRDEETGEYVLLADRWHTCFYDLSGNQGLLGQVEGRTADDAAYWLAGATPAWRDAVRVVAIDMCTIYQSAVQRMLPGRGDRRGPVPRRPARRQDRRRRAPPRDPGALRPPRQGRRPRVRHQAPAGEEPGEPVTGTIREDHRDPGRHRPRPAHRPGLDRQGETPPRAEPPRPRHRLASPANARSGTGSFPSTTGARRTRRSPS